MIRREGAASGPGAEVDQQEHKRKSAQAALERVAGHEVIGVGSGSTVRCFIECLATRKGWLEGAVAASLESERALREHGIPVLDPNSAGPLPVYVDGADEATRHRCLIKGGGGALTREKVLASVSERFICIVDDTKLVEVLGRFPLPVEVLPMARSAVARALTAMGGTPVWRRNCVTDNGNHILDARGLSLSDPRALESELDRIPGVVGNGIFARRSADLLLVAAPEGVREFS